MKLTAFILSAGIALAALATPAKAHEPTIKDALFCLKIDQVAKLVYEDRLAGMSKGQAARTWAKSLAKNTNDKELIESFGELIGTIINTAYDEQLDFRDDEDQVNDFRAYMLSLCMGDEK